MSDYRNSSRVDKVLTSYNRTILTLCVFNPKHKVLMLCQLLILDKLEESMSLQIFQIFNFLNEFDLLENG